jgi:hypothetical protein
LENAQTGCPKLSGSPYKPDPRKQQKWRLSKLEQEVSPFEVVSGGNRNMHAVTGLLSYKDENVSLRIDSLDAAVV